MSTNKQALIRYHALDQCFRNNGRKYFIDDLVKVCNKAIVEFSGVIESVKKRQIYDDIRFMESEQGWSIPLKRIKFGKKVFYRYSDLSFSIRGQLINENELNKLQETLLLLSRFKGMPHFEWIDEIMIRLETVFNVHGETKEIVGFEQNPYLKGLNYFTDLFNYILYKKPISVTYKSFKQNSKSVLRIHPYYLKQYNNRWYLFGLNQEMNLISTLALDRIISINELSIKYIENNCMDILEYFEDIVGVTLPNENETEIIQLKIDNALWPYIETKPIHGSQKIIRKTRDYTTVELSLKINYELETLIFSFSDRLVVEKPKYLSDKIKKKAQNSIKNCS